jgi:hypothetical protein
MTRYEYRVLPAPSKGVKVKGARTTEARFAHALMELMNELGGEGWEYQRTDTLPCEERVGLTGRATRFQNMLVFRRALAETVEEPVRSLTFLRNGAEAETPQAADEVAMDDAADAADAATGLPKEETRESVADRLAATLRNGNHSGRVSTVNARASAGNAPKLGAATGKGMVQPGGHS